MLGVAGPAAFGENAFWKMTPTQKYFPGNWETFNIFEKSGGEISRKNNKGVLDRPWTKWKILTGHF